jgi:hypothetical protein
VKDETAFRMRASAGTAVALSELNGFEAALMRIRVFVKLIVASVLALRIASSLKANGSRVSGPEDDTMNYLDVAVSLPHEIF